MLPHSNLLRNELDNTEEFVCAVAKLVLTSSGQFTSTYELTNQVCDRYFAVASTDRATNVAPWPTSQAQQDIKVEDSHETRTSRPMHSTCA
jgi:hypothetical protein